MKRLLLLAALVLVAQTAQAKDCDVAILNGRVMDPETKLDAVRNVCVEGGKITAITTDEISGRETIDASDHVVAPGFIDGHVHIVDVPLGQKALLRDGVTTTLDLEAGAMPVGRWYDDLEGKSQTNYGATVSVGGARTGTFDPNYLKKTRSSNIVFDMFSGVKVTGDTYSRVPTDAETDNILQLVEQGLKEGALGVGPPVGYMVDGLTSKEMVGVQKLAGKYDRFSHVHTRFSSQTAPTSGILAFQEAIASAGAFGGGVIIAHSRHRRSI